MEGTQHVTRRQVMAAPRPKRETPYGEDLAFVHDVGFGGFARRAASGVLSAR